MAKDPLEGKKLSRERKTHQAQPEWDSPGMDLMEQALHVLDEEAADQNERVGHLLLCLARLEHVHIVAHQSVKKHLPEHVQQALPDPERFYNRESLKDKILEQNRTEGTESDTFQKECTKCKQVKYYTEFGKASRNKDGRDCVCRDCERAYRASLREKS